MSARGLGVRTGEAIAAGAPVYLDTTGLLRAGQRFGMSTAEAEAGCRALTAKLSKPLPPGFDSSWFEAPFLVADEMQSFVEQQARAARDAQERQDRQVGFLLFGVHL